MTKTRKVIVGLCATAVLAILAILWIYSPCNDSSYQNQSYHPSNYDCASALGRLWSGVARIGIWIRDFDGADWTAIATILLVAVTFLLAWVAQQQHVTTRAQLRAYVFVDLVKIENVVAGGNAKIVMRIKNFGQTPAFKLSHAAELRYMSYPIADRFPERVIRSTATTVAVAPGGTMEKFTELQDAAAVRTALTPEQISGLANETGCIMLNGDITYEDAFGHKRYTKYRMIYGGFAPASGTSISAYTDGNEAT